MIIVSTILAIIGILAILFITTDGIIAFNEWQQRIHIGRWSNRKNWQKAIEKKAKEWLYHSPTVSIKDQSRLLLWDILQGNYRSSTIQSWQDAGLLLGLNNEEVATSYVKRHPNLFNSNMQCDVALLAYALKKQGVLSTEYETIVKSLFQTYNDNNETIPYRKQLPDIRFVDTIGLTCPFLYACGYHHLAKRQMEEYDQTLFNHAFPPHAYDLRQHKPMGVFDWSRGAGWYILGLIETAELEGNKERILQLASSLLSFMRPEGGLNCMYFNQQERYESSGSALSGLLYTKAYELSNDKRYLEAARKTEQSLMKATRRNGAIDFAQGDTKGIGFYSRQFSIMPFAQGMALYLSKQLDKFENQK